MSNQLLRLNEAFGVNLTPVKNGVSVEKIDSQQRLAEEQSEDSTFPSDCSKSENDDNIQNGITALVSPVSNIIRHPQNHQTFNDFTPSHQSIEIQTPGN